MHQSSLRIIVGAIVQGAAQSGLITGLHDGCHGKRRCSQYMWCEIGGKATPAIVLTPIVAGGNYWVVNKKAGYIVLPTYHVSLSVTVEQDQELCTNALYK